MAKRMEKAACIPPDDLHDKQVESLLKKLKSPKILPPEARKMRRALRKLGHKGGLGGKPPVGVAPRVKPTVPTTVKPKPRPKKPVVPEPAVRPKMKPHKLNEPNWKQQAAWENGLDKKEKAVLRRWTQGGDKYQELRYGTVGRKVPEYADIVNPLPKLERDKLIATFQSALARSPQYEGEVFRALGFGSKKTVVKNFRKGKTIEFKYTQSGSRSAKIAETFIDGVDEMGEIGVRLRVKSKTGTYLGKLSLRDPSLKMHQEEVLLHAKTRYKIKSVKFIKNPDYFSGGYYDVVMVEL